MHEKVKTKGGKPIQETEVLSPLKHLVDIFVGMIEREGYRLASSPARVNPERNCSKDEMTWEEGNWV